MHRLIALFASVLLLAWCALPLPVAAQNTTGLTLTTCGSPPNPFKAGNPGPFTVNLNGQLCVTGSISASLAGFNAESYLTPFTATTGGVASGSFTAGKVIVVSNDGTTNTAYCKLGAASTTSGQPIKPGSWFAFTTISETQVACATSTSTTTINVAVGTGLPTGAGGGGATGGGGGTSSSFGAAFPSTGTAAGFTDGTNMVAGRVRNPGSGAIVGDAAVVVADPNLWAIAQSSTPAGENHVGEIGSNQIKVQVAQTVTASAYSAGNALGGLMTVASATRVSGSAGAAGTGGILTGLQLNSKTIQTGVQVDIFVFDANPTGSTCTDKTAFVIAAADFDKVVGVLTIPSTAANGAGWFGATTTGAVGIPTYYPVTYDLASSTSIYACAVVRAAITPATTSDISFKFNMLRN